MALPGFPVMEAPVCVPASQVSVHSGGCRPVLPCPFVGGYLSVDELSVFFHCLAIIPYQRDSRQYLPLAVGSCLCILLIPVLC